MSRRAPNQRGLKPKFGDASSSASFARPSAGSAARVTTNVAVIFALSAIPIISFVGAAVGDTRAGAACSAMQAAFDSTALTLSKDLSTGTIAPSQISTKATSCFGALYDN